MKKLGAVWFAVATTLVATSSVADSRSVPFLDAKELTPYWPTEGDRYTPATVTSFQVVDQSGATVNEKTMAGRTSLVNFFFADCPGICPTMMRNLARFRKRIGAKAEHVGFFSFSVHPDEDPPAKLRKYARDYGIPSADWRLLTGDRSTIYGIGKGVFKADGSVGKQKGETSFIHTKNVYLVDRDLRIRGVYDTSSAKEMNGLAEDLGRLEQETR